MSEMSKISNLTALPGASVDTANDLLEIVDVSETVPVDRNKKITIAELAEALTEAIQDIVGAMVAAGTNIAVTYDDGAGTVTIDASALGPGDISGFNEAVDDRVAALLQAGSGIGKVYDDAAGTLTLTATAGSFATTTEVNTGTETNKAISPDALAGSNFGKAVVTILVSDPAGSAITTGDGKAYYRVPSTLNGMNLVSVAAALTTSSSSGIPTIQIANATDSVDMLSTKLTIDASETDSSTAATAAVIDTTHDDVATGDMLRIDIDVAGTGAKGLIVEMQFQLP